MNTPDLLPIVVGVTGHRDIPPECVKSLEEIVAALIAGIQKNYPHSPVLVLSALADGADRICARAALNAGCCLQAPLPMPREEYAKDFCGDSLAEFDGLLSRAERNFTVSGDAPPPKDAPRGFYYRRLGEYIANHSHLLIALWDGTEKLSPEGGGTYETICFARKQNIPVCNIFTRRFSNPEAEAVFADCAVADKRLKAINGYNRDIVKHAAKIESSVSANKRYVIDAETEAELSSGSSALLGAHLSADALSLIYRNIKLLSHRLLSWLGLSLVLSFLLYDEMESDLMLYIYGAIFAAACAVYLFSRRTCCHEKYIVYRALAEAFRVQFYWKLGGIAEDAWDYYTYTQRAELDFVRFFALAINAGCRGAEAENKVSRGSVFDCWIRGQHDYHAGSAKAKGKQDSLNGAFAKTMLALSVALFVAVLFMELFFKTEVQNALPVSEALRNILLMHEGQVIILRSALKIALGALSAGTAFLSNYYGALALPQQIFDSKRMRALFESVLRTDYQNQSEFDRVMRLIGRESLIESAGWYITQRENAPGLFIS